MWDLVILHIQYWARQFKTFKQSIMFPFSSSFLIHRSSKYILAYIIFLFFLFWDRVSWLDLNITQTKVTWEEGTSIEELHPTDWPVAMSAGPFAWLISDVERPSPLWGILPDKVVLGGVRKRAEQASAPPWFLLQFLVWFPSVMGCNLKAKYTRAFPKSVLVSVLLKQWEPN